MEATAQNPQHLPTTSGNDESREHMSLHNFTVSRFWQELKSDTTSESITVFIKEQQTDEESYKVAPATSAVLAGSAWARLGPFVIVSGTG